MVSNLITRKKLLLCIFTFAILSLIPTQSFAEEQIPDWVKNTFVWFADGIITETDVLNAIKYLVENDIIVLDVATKGTDVSNLIQSNDDSKSVDIPVTTHDKVDYTVLVYVVGSDLESKWNLATADFKEMIQGNPNDSVSVILQTGGAKATPSGDRTVDFTKVKIHEVTGSGLTELHDLGEKNMGVPSTLSDFLVWGTQSYPAEKFVLILWNHGSGINGYGIDEVNRDYLTLDELDGAMSNAKQRNDVNYEIIGFDACLMATLEVANIMKNYATYMVASEEFEVGYGWKYDEIISSLNDNSKQSGAELGKVIADSFFADTKAKSTSGQDLSRLTTLSVVDLGKISSLNESINSLTAKIENSISEKDMPKFSVSLRDTERYGIVSKGKDSGHMDIRHFTDNISEFLPQFKNESEKVKQDFDDVVIYKVNGAAKAQANGLSIYMPKTSDAVSTTYRSSTTSTNQFYSNYLDQDKIAPVQNLTITDKTITGTYSGDDVYEIKSYFTTQKNSDGLIQIIATDEFDPDETEYGFTYGNVNYAWDHYLPSLCVNDYETCVPVNPEWEWGDTADLAYIPVTLESNGNKIDVDLLYDITIDDGEIFIGAYPINSDETFDKNLLALNSGDVVTAFKEINHFDSKQSLFIPNTENPVTVANDFGFAWEIYEGTFYIVIEICDYSGNCSYSDFFEFIITEEDLDEIFHDDNEDDKN